MSTSKFTPEEVSYWLQYSPEAFIAAIVNEIRQETLFIEFRAKIIHEDPNTQGLSLAELESMPSVGETTVKQLTDNILNRAERIKAVLNTASAYVEARNQANFGQEG